MTRMKTVEALLAACISRLTRGYEAHCPQPAGWFTLDVNAERDIVVSMCPGITIVSRSSLSGTSLGLRRSYNRPVLVGPLTPSFPCGWPLS